MKGFPQQIVQKATARKDKRIADRKKESVFRDASQFTTSLSASLPGGRCIFEQEKTGEEERNERF